MIEWPNGSRRGLMITSARSKRSRAPRRALAATSAGMLLLASTAVPGLALASPSLTADDESASDRVLQSVAVTMAPDGTLTDVEGTTVETAAGADESESDTRSYSPDDVVGELPVRVLTAYRTEDGAGTDLADLAGHSGRIEIELTVQNLTLRPQTLEYDVDGTSRTRSALVGAPLTVVASTLLEDVDAGSVVTGTSTGAQNVTNGVLSQDAEGATQVQWATILAPPQIGASATLRLVLDADDFRAPDFDVSVQPGLVADASVGALIDAAFRPGDSSELELQSRTIGLVGEVNTVLARAGETISKVRTTLDSSAETLGTKTVADLEASATSVSSSMQSLDGSVRSLGADISSSLDSTRSSVLQQLLATVNTLDQMLGDTSVKPRAAKVRGEGCDTTVAQRRNAASVYGTVAQVASQLKGFSQATDACKVRLQTSILASAGPAEPSVEKCQTASVTCALFGARASFGEIAEELVASGDQALTALEPASIADAVAAAARLSADVDRVSLSTEALLANSPLGRVKLELDGVDDALAEVRVGTEDLTAVVDGLHSTAVAARADVDAMATQNAALAAELCAMVGDGSEPDTLSAAKVEELRASLVTLACDGTTELTPPGGSAMETRIEEQAAVWDSVVAATDTAPTAAGAGRALAALTADIEAVDAQLFLLHTIVERDSGDVDRRLSALDTNVAKLRETRTDVTERIATVREQQAQVVANVKAAFRDAADEATANVNDVVDPQIRRVTNLADQSRKALGTMFDRSASGLSGAANEIAQDGARSLNAQKKSFAREQQAAGVRISAQVENGLAGIARGVAASTRDTEAAAALLTQDLNRVLLDLGDREVDGSGLLGAMTTGAATARTADYQLALATDKATSYANVRSADIGGLLLRQAQSDAALRMEAELPPFMLDLPAGTEHRTVYTFHLGGDS